MSETLNPAATQHLPVFITAPGQPDVLMNVTIVFLLVMVLIVGNLYLRLHALPERLAHKSNVVQLEVVAVLALLALFTHNNLFWVAALLLAFVRIPDFSGPLDSIAASLQRIAGAARAGYPASPEPAVAAAGPEVAEAPSAPSQDATTAGEPAPDPASPPDPGTADPKRED